jgi:hypothetical protein
MGDPGVKGLDPCDHSEWVCHLAETRKDKPPQLRTRFKRDKGVAAEYTHGEDVSDGRFREEGEGWRDGKEDPGEAVEVKGSVCNDGASIMRMCKTAPCMSRSKRS